MSADKNGEVPPSSAAAGVASPPSTPSDTSMLDNNTHAAPTENSARNGGVADDSDSAAAALQQFSLSPPVPFNPAAPKFCCLCLHSCETAGKNICSCRVAGKACDNCSCSRKCWNGPNQHPTSSRGERAAAVNVARTAAAAAAAAKASPPTPQPAGVSTSAPSPVRLLVRSSSLSSPSKRASKSAAAAAATVEQTLSALKSSFGVGETVPLTKKELDAVATRIAQLTAEKDAAEARAAASKKEAAEKEIAIRKLKHKVDELDAKLCAQSVSAAPAKSPVSQKRKGARESSKSPPPESPSKKQKPAQASSSSSSSATAKKSGVVHPSRLQQVPASATAAATPSLLPSSSSRPAVVREQFDSRQCLVIGGLGVRAATEEREAIRALEIKLELTQDQRPVRMFKLKPSHSVRGPASRMSAPPPAILWKVVFRSVQIAFEVLDKHVHSRRHDVDHASPPFMVRAFDPLPFSQDRSGGRSPTRERSLSPAARPSSAAREIAESPGREPRVRFNPQSGRVDGAETVQALAEGVRNLRIRPREVPKSEENKRENSPSDRRDDGPSSRRRLEYDASRPQQQSQQEMQQQPPQLSPSPSTYPQQLQEQQQQQPPVTFQQPSPLRQQDAMFYPNAGQIASFAPPMQYAQSFPSYGPPPGHFQQPAMSFRPIPLGWVPQPHPSHPQWQPVQSWGPPPPPIGPPPSAWGPSFMPPQ
jgi:hypothetical protein